MQINSGGSTNTTLTVSAKTNGTIGAIDTTTVTVNSVENPIYINSTQLSTTIVNTPPPPPTDYKIIVSVDRYSIFSPWNFKASDTSLSANFTAYALLLDNNGKPVSGQGITFKIYSGDGTVKATETSITQANGLASVPYDTYADFTGSADTDYGTWKIEAYMTNSPAIISSANMEIQAGGNTLGGGCKANCHSTNVGTGGKPQSPYTDGYGQTSSRAVAAHKKFQHQSQGCYKCHPGYSEIKTGTYGNTSDVHKNMTCDNCHDTWASFGSSSGTGIPRMPSCYDCHPVSNNNVSIISTLANLAAGNGISVYSYNFDLKKPLAAHNGTMYSLVDSVPCIACHGPTHNISKPYVTSKNNVTENEQCWTCHTNRETTHKSNTNCVGCHTQNAHNISIGGGGPLPPVTYIPADPTNLQNTTGNFWVNNTWLPGIGNTTDSYNVSVNGTWYNGTINTFENTTTVPHGWVNITVWAYNSSGTGSLSAGSVSQNTQVPNNQPVQAPIGNKPVNEGQLLTFTVSATDMDNDTIAYGTNATKGTLNTTTGQFSWTPGYEDAGVYVWYFNSSDSYGGVASETITVTVNNVPLTSTSSSPASDPATIQGAAQSFNLTLNRTANVTWYIYGSVVQTNSSVLSAGYTNSTANAGVYNITASATDGVDSVSRKWNWTVNPQPVYAPSITSWGNSKTNNNITLAANTSEIINFNATANQTITTWNWYQDGVNQNNNYDNLTTSWNTAGTKSIQVNATNNNGTSNTVTWTITVLALPATYIPPSPNITSITGNFWVNTTWQPGAGNVTDSYNINVNGAWINGTTNTSVNSSLSAHAWQNVTVYAYNASGGGSLSTSPTTKNTQVLNNLPVQTSIGAKSVDEGLWLNFTVHATDVDNDTITYGTNATRGSFNATTGNFTWLTTYLDAGTYVWYFNSSDGYGGVATEAITITVNNAPLSITSSSPPADPTTTQGISQSFSISLNRTADVTWYMNGTQVQTDASTTSAIYANSTAGTGTWNVTAIATDGIDIASRPWNWTVNVPQPVTYIPPDPTNLQNTAGNFWVNHTWQAGSGNTTNSYNVSMNGIWYNGIIDTFKNTTTTPHGWLNITVWAYNSSGTGSLSAESVSQNTQVPNNLPQQVSIGTKAVDEGQLLSFIVSASDADNDTITYGTNATKGSLNTASGQFSWTPGYGDAGIYVWYFNSSDGYGGVTTETVTVNVNNIPLSITSSSPFPDQTTTQGTAQGFNIILNRTADITWYMNGIQVQTNESITSAVYTNSTAGIGTWNVTASVTDGIDTASGMWNWTVISQPTYNISGYVFDNYGSGLSDIQVQNDSKLSTTVASGYYLITGLFNGTYNFSYTKAGFNTDYLEVTVSGADYINANKTIYDTTPPAQVTGLTNDTPTQTTVNLIWNTVTDVNYYQVFRDSASLGYTQNNYWNDSGLTADTLYEYTVRANDSYNNWGQNSSILSVRTAQAADTTPPVSVSAPATTTGNFYVNNTWTNPADADYSHAWFRYSNGTTLTNVSKPASYLNLTWRPHYIQNISAQTVDTSDNVNPAKVWFNVTIPTNVPAQSTIGNKAVDEGLWLNFTVSATDADIDIITYGTNATKGTFDTATGNFLWHTTYSDAGTYIWYFNSSDGYGGVASETITVTVNYIPLSITSFSPPSDSTTTQGTAQTFNITLNRTANVTWYMNGTQVQIDTGTTSTSYTNSTAAAGTWNVTASATDGADTVSRTWNWTVNAMLPTTYIPADPTNLQNTAGNFWVNHTWQPGAGNTTDSYNVSVNGTWYNSTTDAFKNSTTAPHGWVNITVRAHNSSGTGSLSPGSISQDTQVANNPPSQDPIGNKAVDEGQLLTFKVNATDADNDTITYGTNVTKGAFNTTTGDFSWIPAYGDAGIYTWYFNSSDGYGGVASETVTVTVNNVRLSITSSVPAIDPTTTAGTLQTFEMTLNRTANISWYIDGSAAQTNSSVASADYTNSTAGAGIYNVTAIADDGYDSASKQWNWTVAPPVYIPGIISWSNSKTNNDSLTLAVNTSEPVNFNATANQTITTWNWYQDGVNQVNNYDNFTASWNTTGTKTVQVNATNSNGTSNTITWTVLTAVSADVGPNCLDCHRSVE
ncbi:MAG: hypothetical protein SCH70_10955 [Candidatus Methanoperedens sp.]|nr:hypothetical protein [Candidatus Methanoperedens sp.]